MKNIVLIGMPGAGKTTIGIKLAKKLGFEFVDTDKIIEEKNNQKLQYIINNYGIHKMKSIEEKVMLDLKYKENTVISPGGSVIYSYKAMNKLEENSLIIYLNVSIEKLEKRIDVNNRGIIKKENQSFFYLFKERKMLYEKYADIIIDCNNKSIYEIVDIIIEKILI